MIGNQHIRSFYFNGKSTEEIGLVLNYFRVKMPSKAKNRVPLPHTNKTLDFSAIYGEQLYGDREIDAKVTLPGFEYLSHSDKWSFWTQFTNWLMSTTERSSLTYSMMPEYYFMAEVDKEPTFEEFEFSGAMSFTFSCYPFRVSSLPEGHDLVAFMNTKLDVRQQTNFTFKSYWNSFKELNVGDYATYGAWATVYQTDTGTGTKINPGFHGYTYKIVDKKTVNQSRSQIAYKLDNHNEWLLEQDILQAQTEYLDITLVNNGIAAVIPIITASHKVTIVRGDEIFNLQGGIYETDQFMLETGINKMKIYIANITLNISFDFHKELI